MTDQDRKPENPAGGKPDTAADAPAPSPKGKERDRTLTEKAEEGAGGANRRTPGPIYDV